MNCLDAQPTRVQRAILARLTDRTGMQDAAHLARLASCSRATHKAVEQFLTTDAARPALRLRWTSGAREVCCRWASALACAPDALLQLSLDDAELHRELLAQLCGFLELRLAVPRLDVAVSGLSWEAAQRVLDALHTPSVASELRVSLGLVVSGPGKLVVRGERAHYAQLALSLDFGGGWRPAQPADLVIAANPRLRTVAVSASVDRDANPLVAMRWGRPCGDLDLRALGLSGVCVQQDPGVLLQATGSLQVSGVRADQHILRAEGLQVRGTYSFPPAAAAMPHLERLTLGDRLACASFLRCPAALTLTARPAFSLSLADAQSLAALVE